MASSKSSAANTSSQTTSTVTDSYNQTSNFTENFSNVGNETTTLHFGPETTSGAPGTSSLSTMLIPLALGAVALVLLLLRLGSK